MNNYKNFYFIGIGGIGMSALARYFKSLGKNVLGYDKTETKLTSKLQEEDIKIRCFNPKKGRNARDLYSRNQAIGYFGVF